MTNDVSARDVQLTKTQFYEAKSYPTFTPVGPALVLLDADELNRFGDLRLELQVNGEVRQNMLVHGDMIYPPLQALQSLAQFQRLGTGDLIMTGTPGRDGSGRATEEARDKAFLSARPATRSTGSTATSWNSQLRPMTAPSISAPNAPP